MKSFFISQNSICSEEHYMIRQVFNKYNESVLKEIDENIEVWILGNEDTSLFEDILKRLSNNTVSNPIDNSPLQINNVSICNKGNI